MQYVCFHFISTSQRFSSLHFCRGIHLYSNHIWNYSLSVFTRSSEPESRVFCGKTRDNQLQAIVFASSFVFVFSLSFGKSFIDRTRESICLGSWTRNVERWTFWNNNFYHFYYAHFFFFLENFNWLEICLAFICLIDRKMILSSHFAWSNRLFPFISHRQSARFHVFHIEFMSVHQWNGRHKHMLHKPRNQFDSFFFVCCVVCDFSATRATESVIHEQFLFMAK